MRLFKPAWQSKNELRALEVLEKVTGVSKLAEIAQNATLDSVRECAASRKKALEQKASTAKLMDAETRLCPVCGAVTQGQGIEPKCTNFGGSFVSC